MRTYEVEFKSTTYRHYYVEARNEAEAEERAMEQLQTEGEASPCWVENAEVERVEDTKTGNTWQGNGQLED